MTRHRIFVGAEANCCHTSNNDVAETVLCALLQWQSSSIEALLMLAEECRVVSSHAYVGPGATKVIKDFVPAVSVFAHKDENSRAVRQQAVDSSDDCDAIKHTLECNNLHETRYATQPCRHKDVGSGESGTDSVFPLETRLCCECMCLITGQNTAICTLAGVGTTGKISEKPWPWPGGEHLAEIQLQLLGQDVLHRRPHRGALRRGSARRRPRLPRLPPRDGGCGLRRPRHACGPESAELRSAADVRIQVI